MQTRQELIQPFHDKVQEEADGIITYFITGYLIFGLVLSPFYNTWSLGIVMGGTSFGIYYFAKAFLKNKLWFRLLVSLLFWNFPLQFLLQMHGAYEIQFFYFISLTVLLFYEDWRLILPAAIYALVTFLYIFISQESGTLMEAMPTLTFQNVLLHLGLLVFYAGLCMLWSRLQRRQTAQTGINQLQMEEQLKLMDTNIDFANNISKGNLNIAYEADQADKLGQSLMNMRDSLVEASEREAKEKFVNVGLASIGEILRNHSDNLTELSDQLIEKLVKYMKANQGGVYILNNVEGEEKYLELVACRAFERKKFLNRKIEIGEGLVGQAVVERQTIHMKELPTDYINITSGLGLANPNSLVIIPLKSNEEVVGCIEMATFKSFSDTDIEFLEKVGESIASAILSAQTNQQTKELLEQSKQMTEEMRAQEEEMRQNMEEMQATQEEMLRNQKELGEKEANLNALINNTTDSIITIDRSYTIIVMNDVLKNRYRGTQYEGFGEGTNALDMLGEVKDEWKGYYDRAFQGERLNFVLKSSVKGEYSWREYFINPMRDNNGGTVGASIISRDISDKMRALEEMKNKEFVLDAMINSTTDSYMAIDTAYSVTVLNEVAKKQFAAIGLSVEIGDNLNKKLPSNLKKIWMSRYDTVFTGEHLQIEEEQSLEDKTHYFIHSCVPIKNDKQDTVGAAIVSKDVTESRELALQVESLSEEINTLKKK